MPTQSRDCRRLPDRVRIRWTDFASGRADALDGVEVEIVGWMAALERAEAHAYFLVTPEPICCLSCLPTDPMACVEVFADRPIPARGLPLRLAGMLHRLVNDAAGWRYQMRAARLIGLGDRAVSRRNMMAAGAALALAGYSSSTSAATRQRAAATSDPDSAKGARALVEASLTIDIHSHAGHVNNPNTQLTSIAPSMREGGMSVVCLAMVADRPVTRVMPDKRISAIRAPNEGELYSWSQTGFARINILAQSQGMTVVTDIASLNAARTGGPAAIIAAEGADFLDRSLERIEEAYTQHRLRHLQLTHYRVNNLGDIQTEAPVHGGLTDFGAEVVRACNRRGIVVDVAHGTYDLVKKAAAVTSKPLVLSHTSLANKPGPLSRQITADHARAIAGTGGVIGVWPVSAIYPDKAAMATGMARLADVVGVEHVGLGSDMLGLVGPSVFDSYSELPELASALLAVGFSSADATKILGGNYARVFAATIR
jgi:membrane dipeptidase